MHLQVLCRISVTLGVNQTGAVLVVAGRPTPTATTGLLDDVWAWRTGSSWTRLRTNIAARHGFALFVLPVRPPRCHIFESLLTFTPSARRTRSRFWPAAGGSLHALQQLTPIESSFPPRRESAGKSVPIFHAPCPAPSLRFYRCERSVAVPQGFITNCIAWNALRYSERLGDAPWRGAI